jgi:hypothetical protein
MSAGRWLRQLGVWVFLGFLVKGLLWLLIPVWIVGKGCGS